MPMLYYLNVSAQRVIEYHYLVLKGFLDGTPWARVTMFEALHLCKPPPGVSCMQERGICCLRRVDVFRIETNGKGCQVLASWRLGALATHLYYHLLHTRFFNKVLTGYHMTHPSVMIL